MAGERRRQPEARVRAVAGEIQRLIDGSDRRYRSVGRDGMEFLVAMGLLAADDPAERHRAYAEAVKVALLWGRDPATRGRRGGA